MEDVLRPLTAADVVENIMQGNSYITIHSVHYPAGEINNRFGLAPGTAAFTPPPKIKFLLLQVPMEILKTPTKSRTQRADR